MEGLKNKMKVMVPEKILIKAIQQHYFNKSDAANYLGVSIPTFSRWLIEFDLKTIRVDGKLCWSKDELDRFMKSKEEG